LVLRQKSILPVRYHLFLHSGSFDGREGVFEKVARTDADEISPQFTGDDLSFYFTPRSRTAFAYQICLPPRPIYDTLFGVYSISLLEALPHSSDAQ
ncbi:4976_t:CDS:2, partial [Acaulospora morrowiae]